MSEHDTIGAAVADGRETLTHLSVLVPTFRRPFDLKRCLTAIAAQTRRPDSTIIVCREDDSDTRALLEDQSIRGDATIAYVNETGVVAALNAGLEAFTGDIIAITDDDAAPRPDWLDRIERRFREDATIGGLGGRDYVHGISPDDSTNEVGKISWFGRQIGNHHLGIGKPRYVHMLKGANMSFRRDAINALRFDSRLRGTGAQVHNELAFSLEVRRRGWKLMYDPAVAVDHYPAPRFDEDQRSQRSQLAASNSAYNETLILLEHLPLLSRPAFFIWAMLIGPRDLPGLVQAIRLALIKDTNWMRFPAVLHGRVSALRALVSATQRH